MEGPKYYVSINGRPGVGKSAIIVQFTTYQFIDELDEPDMKGKDKYHIDVADQSSDSAVRLTIFDGTGPSKDDPSYCDQIWGRSHGFIIVYDVTDRKSFEAVDEIREEMLKANPKKDIPIYICGNKTDLKDKRQVTTEEGKKKAQELGCLFTETSAKTDPEIDEMFKNLVRAINGKAPKSKKEGACLVM